MSQSLKPTKFDFFAYGAFSAYALCSLSIPLVLVAMANDLHFPLADGGMAAGGGLHMARSIAMVVALLMCGSVAGRLGNRISMGGSMVLMGTGILFCAFSDVYWLLIPLLLLAGFGEGLCEGVATPFVQQLHPDEPERYVNIAHSFWSVGIVICVLFSGGLLTLGISWRVVLCFCGVLALLSAVPFFIWRNYPERSNTVDTGEVIRQSIAIFKTPRFWVYSAGMFMGAGSEFCLTFWAASFLELNFSASAFVAGLGTGTVAVGMFVGRNLTGYFGNRRRMPRILLGAGLGTIPITLLLAFLTPETVTDKALLFTLLFLTLFLCGIGISPFWPTLQVHGVNNLPELDSTMLYIYFSAWGVPGCGFFTWIMGVLGDRYGLQNAFLLIPSTLIIFAAIIFLEHWIFKNKRPAYVKHDAAG